MALFSLPIVSHFWQLCGLAIKYFDVNQSLHIIHADQHIWSVISISVLLLLSSKAFKKVFRNTHPHLCQCSWFPPIFIYSAGDLHTCENWVIYWFLLVQEGGASRRRRISRHLAVPSSSSRSAAPALPTHKVQSVQWTRGFFNGDICDE